MLMTADWFVNLSPFLLFAASRENVLRRDDVKAEARPKSMLSRSDCRIVFIRNPNVVDAISRML